jgi:hypothetical protein
MFDFIWPVDKPGSVDAKHTLFLISGRSSVPFLLSLALAVRARTNLWHQYMLGHCLLCLSQVHAIESNNSSRGPA